MSKLSLVAAKKIEKDPRKLAYLYPKMPVSRYKEKVDEYYRLQTLRSVEQVAAINNSILLPSGCVHHKRRDPERRMMIYGRTYYVFPVDELTDLELEKYKTYCENQGETE